MCRRTAVAVAAVLSTTLGSLAGAQTVSPETRAMERRVDTLVAIWRAAVARLSAFDDSVARTRARMDTVQAGSLRLLVERSLRPRVEPAARIAAARVEAIVGPAAARLSKRWLVAHQLRDSTPDSIVVAVLEAPRAFENHQLWGAPDDQLLAAWIQQNALHAIAAEIDPEFKKWLHAELLPDTVSTLTWTQHRLDLVSSHSFHGERCYRGDSDACATALRLRDVDDPVLQWYDAAGRRRVVQNWLEDSRGFRRGNWPEMERCVAGDDAECIAEMRRHRPVDPVPPGMRASLAKLAVQMGGPGGYERMLAASGTPAQRLAAAAGVPADSVLRAWQRKVRDTRLPSQDFSATIAASSLAWILVCGALALRSTRWR